MHTSNQHTPGAYLFNTIQKILLVLNMHKEIFANTVSTADEGNSSNHTYQKEGKLLLLMIELSCMLLIRSCYFIGISYNNLGKTLQVLSL